MSEQVTKILIVDDDPFVRSMLGDILTPTGYVVETANHGAEGMQKYASDSQVTLIISDMNMPEMNGLEFVKELRKKDTEIPILHSQGR